MRKFWLAAWMVHFGLVLSGTPDAVTDLTLPLMMFWSGVVAAQWGHKRKAPAGLPVPNQKAPPE